MSDAAIGASVPTLLGRRAAAWGVVSFSFLVGGVLACFVPGVLVGGMAGLAVGVVLGLWAVSLLVRAFVLRRRLIVERHVRELTAVLGEPPTAEIVVRETGCRETVAKELLAPR